VRRGVLGGWEFVGNGDIIVMVILLLLSLKLEAFGMIQGVGTPRLENARDPMQWQADIAVGNDCQNVLITEWDLHGSHRDCFVFEKGVQLLGFISVQNVDSFAPTVEGM